MNGHLRTKAVWPLITACVALAFPCQNLWAQTVPSDGRLLDSAKEIMAATKFCAVATFGDTNSISIREMDPFPPDKDMTVWLGTNRHSRKVKEIERNSSISLFYAAPGGRGYVTITGHAVLVDDEKEKASRWKPEWDAIWKMHRTAGYILIKVIPDRLEVIDYKHGVAGDPVTEAPPSIDFR
jgi:general stress protein 26